jgi:hypothetical protein
MNRKPHHLLFNKPNNYTLLLNQVRVQVWVRVQEKLLLCTASGRGKPHTLTKGDLTMYIKSRNT